MNGRTDTETIGTQSPTRLDALLARLRPAWFALAACRGAGVDQFVTRDSRAATRAREVCAGCPVRVECLDYALDDPSIVGIWGGTSARERSRLRAGVTRNCPTIETEVAA